jgi:Peptidase of plants and bacteria
MMKRSIGIVVASLLLAVPIVAGDEPKPKLAGTPIAATIDTTLRTAQRQVAQLAFDGDAGTYFLSIKNATRADHFSLVFDEPVVVKSIAVATGRPEGGDKLDCGKLEATSDGTTFQDRANFADGSAFAVPGARPIRAIRIKPGADFNHPVAIRELTIESTPPVAVFRYPVEFVVDVTDSPDMKDWAEDAARACARAYPMINDELKSVGYKPPRLVTMTFKNSYRGVAEASSNRITGSSRFFKAHPKDLGALVHETAHVVQNYRGRGNPGWLVEGVSDYVRFFKFEPGKIGPIDAERAHYNGSYRVTAAFLAYLTSKYDQQIVRKLNERMREGRYKNDSFKELTGKSVEELDEEWRTTLKK